MLICRERAQLPQPLVPPVEKLVGGECCKLFEGAANCFSEAHGCAGRIDMGASGRFFDDFIHQTEAVQVARRKPQEPGRELLVFPVAPQD